MHSRKHGKSGSHKPEKKRHAWLMYEPAEIEKLIVKLAKEDKADAEIGIILRDQYGIPDMKKFSGETFHWITLLTVYGIAITDNITAITKDIFNSYQIK